MLSGAAAEGEDSSKREEGQPSLSQPSGIQPSGTQPSGIQPSGTQPSGTQPSGTQSPLTKSTVHILPPKRKRKPKTKGESAIPLSEMSTAELSTTEPSTNEPSISELSTTEPSITELSTTEPSTTEPSIDEPPTAEPSLIQLSGTEPSLIQPSGNQAQAPLSLCQSQEAIGSVKAPAPMPFFTGSHPGTVRLLSPRKDKVTSVVTMSSKEETTRLALTMTPRSEIERRAMALMNVSTPRQQARVDALVQRQRYGEVDGSPWNGLYPGVGLVIGDDGHESMKMNADKAETLKSKDIHESKDTHKSKDIQETEDSTPLLALGNTKTMANKSSSEDEGLGEALDALLSDGGIPLLNSAYLGSVLL